MSEQPGPADGAPEGAPADPASGAAHGHGRASTVTLRGGELAKRSLGSPLLFTSRRVNCVSGCEVFLKRKVWKCVTQSSRV